VFCHTIRSSLTIDGKKYELAIDEFQKDSIFLDGCSKKAELRRLDSKNLHSLTVDKRSYRVYIEPNSDGYYVWLKHRKYFVELHDERALLIRGLINRSEGPKGQVEIKAPMPGLIVKFNVEEGQAVKVGDSLVIIEAMKMENEIRSKTAGTVKKVLRAARDSVDKDALLLVIE